MTTADAVTALTRLAQGLRFQDTGGITSCDGTLIGHGSTITTLKYAVDPHAARRPGAGTRRHGPPGGVRSR